MALVNVINVTDGRLTAFNEYVLERSRHVGIFAMVDQSLGAFSRDVEAYLGRIMFGYREAVAYKAVSQYHVHNMYVGVGNNMRDSTLEPGDGTGAIALLMYQYPDGSTVYKNGPLELYLGAVKQLFYVQSVGVPIPDLYRSISHMFPLITNVPNGQPLVPRRLVPQYPPIVPPAPPPAARLPAPVLNLAITPMGDNIFKSIKEAITFQLDNPNVVPPVPFYDTPKSYTENYNLIDAIDDYYTAQWRMFNSPTALAIQPMNPTMFPAPDYIGMVAGFNHMETHDLKLQLLGMLRLNNINYDRSLEYLMRMRDRVQNGQVAWNSPAGLAELGVTPGNNRNWDGYMINWLDYVMRTVIWLKRPGDHPGLDARNLLIFCLQRLTRNIGIDTLGVIESRDFGRVGLPTDNGIGVNESILYMVQENGREAIGAGLRSREDVMIATLMNIIISTCLMSPVIGSPCGPKGAHMQNITWNNKFSYLHGIRIAFLAATLSLY